MQRKGLPPNEVLDILGDALERINPEVFAMDGWITAQEEGLNYEGLPPFPEDVPIAPLTRIFLSSLLKTDTESFETFKSEDSLHLFEACKKNGFFYLDLDSKDGTELLRDAECLTFVEKALFSAAYPPDEKQEYDFLAKGIETYFGYKGIGTSFADSSQGIKDRNEFWNISQDDLFDHIDRFPAPDILEKTRWLQESFARYCHSFATTILTHLNFHLNLPKDTLPSLHRLKDHSDSQIRLLHAPAQPEDNRGTALGAHTDFGSLTILFAYVGGLQVRVPGKDEWLYVQPLPGTAVVNVGDALVKFSNGVLHSNSHRVVSPPGEQATEPKYSVMYFLRPQDDVVLRSLGGKEGNGVIPATGEVWKEELSSKQVIEKTLKSKGRGGKPSAQETEKMYWEK